MTNAQAALLAAAIYDPGGGRQKVLDVAYVFKCWLDERDAGAPNEPMTEDVDST